MTLLATKHAIVRCKMFLPLDYCYSQRFSMKIGSTRINEHTPWLRVNYPFRYNIFRVWTYQRSIRTFAIKVLLSIIDTLSISSLIFNDTLIKSLTLMRVTEVYKMQCVIYFRRNFISQIYLLLFNLTIILNRDI